MTQASLSSQAGQRMAKKPSSSQCADKYHVTSPLSVDEGKLVFFDLETTGLERDCDILQIAACCGSASFSTYVIPTRPINPGAARVNKISVRDGKMFHCDKEVPFVEPRTALGDFAHFVGKQGAKVILVAHNGKRFDFPRLVLQMDRFDVELPANVRFFLDSLPLMRALYPGRSSHSQANLVAGLLRAEYGAHNASEDARILQELVDYAIRDDENDRDSIETIRELLVPRDVLAPSTSKPSLSSQMERLTL